MLRLQTIVASLAALVIFVIPGTTHATTNKTITTFDTAGSAQDVIVAGNYAYVADGNNGIVVLNVSNSSAPTLVTTVPLPGAQHIDIIGNHLYVAAGLSGMSILDIAAPTSPIFLGSYSQGGLTVEDVATDGTYAYVLGTTNGQSILETLNVTVPNNMVLLGSLAIAAGNDVLLSGTNIYIVGGQKLEIINQYPNFNLVAEYDDPNPAADYRGIEVFGSIAYINDPVLGLHAISVATPSAPVPTFNSSDSMPSVGFGAGLAVSNGYVFLSQTAGGLAIFDIASSSTPHFIDTYAGPAASAVTVANDVAYVAVGTSGVQVVNVGQPDVTPPVIAPAPSGGGTTVVTPGAKFVAPTITATDNAGSTSTTVTGKVDTNKVGKYILTYTVTDREGNASVTKRTVIVAPSLSTVTLKKNTLTIKVGKKNVVLSPFPGYRGSILARKAILDTRSNPFYMFIPVDATRNASIVMYNSAGKLVTRVSVAKISKFGFQVALATNPTSLSVYAGIAPKANGLSNTVYNFSKSGIKSLGTVTHAKGKGTLVSTFLKLYDNEYGLVTQLKGTTKSPLIWRYSTSKKVFVRDTKYALSKLIWTKTSVKLK